MNGKGRRSKGANGEREFAKLLSEKLGIKLERNLEQTRAGGHDLIGLPGIAIEVKRCEQLAINQWWRQAVEQAADGLTPCLAYRQNRKPWMVAVPLNWLLRGEGVLLESEEPPKDKQEYLPEIAVLTVDGFVQALAVKGIQP